MGCLLLYSDYAYSFYDADEFCQGTQSAKLVSIETAQQLDFVKMIIGFLEDHETYAWWTSGSDQGREAEFYWSATLNPIGSFFFASGQPNADGNCVYLNSVGHGCDGDCNAFRFPICQK